MGKMKDAFKKLGFKMNGKEPSGETISEVINSIANDYTGGSGGTSVSANINYAKERGENSVEGLASLKIDDKVYELDQKELEIWNGACLYAEGISEVLTKYLGEEYKVGETEGLQIAFNGVDGFFDIQIGPHSIGVVQNTYSSLVVPSGIIEVEADNLAEMFLNENVISYFANVHFTDTIKINQVGLGSSVSGRIQKYYLLSNSYDVLDFFDDYQPEELGE